MITKAIILAAGYGTRFLPATKIIPKEMLPLIDKPIIQYVVEEAVASGIKEIILVTRPGVSAIRNHFGSKISLEKHLLEQGKIALLETLKNLPKMAKFSFINQDPRLPYGTGAPLVSAAEKIAKNEFFVFMFGDDLVKAKIPTTKQLLDFWSKHNKAIILGVAEVPRNEVSRYGIIKPKKGSINEVEEIIEKPSPEKAPSRLASLGRFILNRGVIDILLEQKEHVPQGKEFYLTEAITRYAKEKTVLAFKVRGKWLTTGDPLNWLKATVEFALGRKDLNLEFRPYLKSLKL